jgi:O-acetyl-ADP-ribose deacetylase
MLTMPLQRSTSAEPGIVSDVLIEIVQANITGVEVDVIVTAANRALIGGGGVDGAVHRAAGSELLQALRPLSPCPVGGAVITPAFGFAPPVRHIVHAVGPRYGVDEPAAELLASAYRTSLTLADEVGAKSIAFPSLSTGAFHYPRHEAAKVSVQALRSAVTKVERCVLVALDVKTARFWERALTQ